MKAGEENEKDQSNQRWRKCRQPLFSHQISGISYPVETAAEETPLPAKTLTHKISISLQVSVHNLVHGAKQSLQ